MIVLSLIIGSVAAGAVWVGWSYAENWAAVRRLRPVADEPVPSETRREAA